MLSESCQICLVDYEGTERLSCFCGSTLVFIEGIQGSGKSSVARGLGELFQNSVERGMPTGQQMSALVDKEHVCQLAHHVFIESIKNDSPTHVFDRSLLSNFIFLLRVNAIDQKYIGCGLHFLEQLVNEKVFIIYLKVDPEVALKRQDQSAHAIISLEDAVLEAEAYQIMMDEIKKNFPWVKVLPIDNSNGKTISELSMEAFIQINNFQ
jgi:thymidylate kinase